MVQLHLQCLVSAGTGQGGGAAGAAGPAGAAAAAAAAAPVPAGTHYLRSAQPSRHLVLLGVAREDVAALAARAAALGRVQKHMHNATGMLTIHFEQQAAAEALAAEAAAGTVPGLAGELPLWPPCSCFLLPLASCSSLLASHHARPCSHRPPMPRCTASPRTRHCLFHTHNPMLPHQCRHLGIRVQAPSCPLWPACEGWAAQAACPRGRPPGRHRSAERAEGQAAAAAGQAACGV